MTDTMLMFDAVPSGVDLIPHDAQAVAGYLDGNFQSFPLLTRRFYPRAHCVSIGVFLGHVAAFSDVEPGNAINTPEKVRADFLHRRAAGVWKPGFYAALDASPGMHDTVLPGLAGIPRSEYRLWVADWDGRASLLPGYEAKQFTNNRRPGGGDGPYDTSIVNVRDFFPAPPPRRHPLPHPHPPKRPILHRKVLAAGSFGGLTTGLIALIHGTTGWNPTPAEASGIATVIATLGGYIVPSNPNVPL